MQDYVKKYFWLVGVITVMICAFLAAESTGHIIEGMYLSDNPEPARTEQARPGRPKASTVRSKSGVLLAQRNMFCSTCQPAPQTPGNEGEMVDPNSVPLTSLPLELLATNLASRSQHSFATIRNTTSDSQGAYWTDQEIPSAGKVVRIGGTFVDFQNTSTQRLERISLIEQNRGGPPRPAPPPTRPPPTGQGQGDEMSEMLDAGIKKLSEDSYEIDRGLVDKMLSNPMSVARGARIVPSVQDGKPNGFKLYAIRPNSVYSKIGLRNGDTISAINGFELTTPDKALEVYTKVREASNLSVSVIRRGKPETMNYNIR